MLPATDSTPFFEWQTVLREWFYILSSHSFAKDIMLKFSRLCLKLKALLMVSIVTSQVRQFTERFIHQSGLFEFFPNTTSGIDRFFIIRLKNQLYGNEKDQIE
jgi:hypothetical protein